MGVSMKLVLYKQMKSACTLAFHELFQLQCFSNKFLVLGKLQANVCTLADAVACVFEHIVAR